MPNGVAIGSFDSTFLVPRLSTLAALPDVRVEDVSVPEGQAEVSLLAFHVSLSSIYPFPVTLNYATSGGTATAGGDYIAAAGSLTFAPGETLKTVAVSVNGDMTNEATETFNFTLSNVVNANVTRGTAVGTIANDDPPATSGIVTVWRLFLPQLGEHLFTTDLNEYNMLGNGGWSREGIAFRMFDKPGLYAGAPTVPLFRLFDRSTGLHHWTADAHEASVLASQPSWDYEGPIGDLLAGPVTGAVPMYRLVLTGTAFHLWTIDPNEHKTLQTKGWKSEGIVGYVLPQS